jgi:hypothetical protein
LKGFAKHMHLEPLLALEPDPRGRRRSGLGLYDIVELFEPCERHVRRELVCGLLVRVCVHPGPDIPDQQCGRKA